MNDNNGSENLIGLKKILGYLEVSKPMFYQLVKLGLPARVINKRWYAHKSNINEWFKNMTRFKTTEIEPDAD